MDYVLRRGVYHKPSFVIRRTKFAGTGELSSSFPSALTTIEGTPVSAQVIVRYRAPSLDGPADGRVVAVTTSSPSGEWQITGLNSALKYDVSARYAGENDALQSNVSPHVPP